MTIGLLFAVTVLAVTAAASQNGPSSTMPKACEALNRAVIDQIATGRSAQAEVAISAALAQGATTTEAACAGLVLNNVACA